MLVKGLPLSIDQALQGLKFGLVAHFSVLSYPIAQIKIGQLIDAALLYLPQDVVSAKTGIQYIRVEKSIDRRETIR